MATYVTNEQLHNGRREGALARAIEQESGMPTNCFTLNGTGEVTQGIVIQLNHPRLTSNPITGKRDAGLVLGEGHVLPRNRKDGCIFAPMENGGYVRRMDIRILEREGKKPLKFLVHPEQEMNGPLFLLVNTTLPGVVRFKEKFWTGVQHSAEMIAQSGDETLLRFNEEGQEARVFYPDGNVVCVVRRGGMLHNLAISIEEKATLRIYRADQALDRTYNLVGDGRAKAEDSALHELIAIMAIGGARSQEVRESIFNRLMQRSDELRPGVKKHALQALSRWPNKQQEFRWACETAVSLKATSKPKGVPAARKAKLAERAEKERERQGRK